MVPGSSPGGRANFKEPMSDPPKCVWVKIAWTNPSNDQAEANPKACVERYLKNPSPLDGSSIEIWDHIGEDALQLAYDHALAWKTDVGTRMNPNAYTYCVKRGMKREDAEMASTWNSRALVVAVPESIAVHISLIAEA